MSIPFVGHVLKGWTKIYLCYLVTQTIVDHTTQNISLVKKIHLTVLPLRQSAIARKPKEEQLWKWYEILERSNQTELKVNDLVKVNGNIFRIDSQGLWDTAGYRRYEMTEYHKERGAIYSLIYDGNDNDSGEAPARYAYCEDAEVTVKDENTLTKDGYVFTGWNTEEDGYGTSYDEYDTITMGTEDITLYAQWEAEE